MKRVLLITLAAAALSACATTPYGQPATPFSEARITDDRYRITWFGARGMDQGAVHDAALLRAADVAVQGGYDWFVVDNQFTEARGGSGYGSGPFVSLGGGNTSFGRRSASSFGAGVGFNLGGAPRPQLSTTLEVRFGRGQPRPDGAYDARDVQQTIRGRML